MRTICLYTDRTCRSNSVSLDASNDFVAAAMYSSGTPSTVSNATTPRTRRAFACSGVLLTDLPWTTAVFLEAMRYFSPAWAIPRVAIRDDDIGGHIVRKGTTVLIPTHRIHHDPRWWPDPEEFGPSRFLPGAVKGRARFPSLPLGGGKRYCIGQGFATMESVLITAMLSLHYRFDLVPGHPVDPEATLTLRPRYGLKMVA